MKTRARARAGAARVAAGHWREHVQARTDLLAGKNTEATTKAIWKRTRLAGPDDARGVTLEAENEACRWVGGMRPSAVMSSPIVGVSSSEKSSATGSPRTAWRGRASSARNRSLITLLAMARSQFAGFRGRAPFSSDRYAFRNVVCVTSSASAGWPSTASAYRYTRPAWLR